jgi:hypothetical protein
VINKVVQKKNDWGALDGTIKETLGSIIKYFFDSKGCVGV